MRSPGYWLLVFVLAACVLSGFSLVVTHGFSGVGIGGAIGALLAAAILLSYGRSYRNGRPARPGP